MFILIFCFTFQCHFLTNLDNPFLRLPCCSHNCSLYIPQHHTNKSPVNFSHNFLQAHNPSTSVPSSAYNTPSININTTPHLVLLLQLPLLLHHPTTAPTPTIAPSCDPSRAPSSKSEKGSEKIYKKKSTKDSGSGT